MRPLRISLLVVAVIATFSAGCAVFRPTPLGLGLVSQTKSTSQPMVKAVFPSGRFSATSTPNILIMVIENDGGFRMFLDNDLLDWGKFEISGSQVLADSAKCAAHDDPPAAYVWSYDDENVLAFQAIAPDPCPGRRRYLAEQYQPKYMFIFSVPDRGVPKDLLS